MLPIQTLCIPGVHCMLHVLLHLSLRYWDNIPTSGGD